MVLYDPERRWAARAICDWDRDHEMFFPESVPPGGDVGSKVAHQWAQAKLICQMCPVLTECARDTLGEEWGVWGGLDQNQRSAVRRRLYRAAKAWPVERRLAWGEEIARLRAGGLSWATIKVQAGLGQVLADELMREWRAHRTEQEQLNAKVVDLPLPEEPSRGPEFPDKPGSRHAWVRHNGRISDAIYRGETPTGAWVFVTVYSGHGHVNKWVRPKNVQMYHRQPVVILSKRNENREPAA